MEEEKRIDFNTPFLSVRRFQSSISTSANANKLSAVNSRVTKDNDLTLYKSDRNSGRPLRDSVVVPFLWEKDPISVEPITVPIVANTAERPPVVPTKLSPCSTSEIVAAAALTLSGESIRGMSEQPTVVEDLREYDDCGEYDDDREDDSYSDTLESLQRNNSGLMNYSISGMTGMGETTLPASCFSSDPQARDFMMRRFLPAAQAMATGFPKATLRKPLNSELNEKIESGAPRSAVRLPYQIRPKNITRYPPSSNKDDDDNTATRPLVFKGFGFLFPKICLRSSVCLVNPSPSSKGRRPSLYAPRYRRPSIDQTSARRRNSPLRRSTGGAVSNHRNGSSAFRSGNGGGLRGNHTASYYDEKIGKKKVVYSFEPSSPRNASNTSSSCNRSPSGPGQSKVVLSLLPTPPPLPQSPSESWLWRTLGMQFNSKSMTTNTSSPDTIVKTSIVHLGQMRLSEVPARLEN